MDRNLVGLLLGGILPAFFYGFAGIFAKISAESGMPIGLHLVCVGIAVTVVGVVTAVNSLDTLPAIAPISSSIAMGLLWGSGTGFVALGLLKYRAPLAKLVPLYNMNTLITVLLALIIFQEWKSSDPIKLILGAIFVIIGGILVSRA